MNQCEKVLNYMKKNGKITQRDAIWLGCYRLSARIKDLRDAGEKINSEMQKVRNADGTHTYIAVYTLTEEEQTDD
jgi:hypothetical protein